MRQHGKSNVGVVERRLSWNWFGQKYEIKQIVELLWLGINTVILNRADYNQPSATITQCRIVSLEPLTIETSLIRPYSKTRTLKIEQGNTPIRKRSLHEANSL